VAEVGRLENGIEERVRAVADVGRLEDGIEEGVRAVAADPEVAPAPSVVWISGPAEDRQVARVERSVLTDERIGIALRRFRCYRVDRPAASTGEDPAGDLPAFLFYDPSGRPVRRLAGPRAGSRAAFAASVEEAWNRSFRSPLGTYAKTATLLLDRRDKVDVKSQVIRARIRRFSRRPTEERYRELIEGLRRLASEWRKLREDERAAEAAVRLRGEFERR
jgi:hypothetical protein